MELAKRKPDPDAYPITAQTVEWESLLMVADQFFGRSLTAGLDRWALKPEGMFGLLAALEEFRNPGSNPHHAQKQGPTEFIHQSFLCLGPWDVMLAATSLGKLAFLVPPELKEKEMFVLGGTLRDWQEVLPALLRPNSTRNTRILFCKILLHFERLGLGATFRTHAKRDLGDGTFYLEPK